MTFCVWNLTTLLLFCQQPTHSWNCSCSLILNPFFFWLDLECRLLEWERSNSSKKISVSLYSLLYIPVRQRWLPTPMGVASRDMQYVPVRLQRCFTIRYSQCFGEMHWGPISLFKEFNLIQVFLSLIYLLPLLCKPQLISGWRSCQDKGTVLGKIWNIASKQELRICFFLLV